MTKTGTDNVYDIETGEKVSGGAIDVMRSYRSIDLDPEGVLRFVNANPFTAPARAKRLEPLIEHLRAVMAEREIGPWLTWRQEFLGDRSVLEIAETDEGLDYLEVIVPLVGDGRPSGDVVAMVR